MKTFRLTRLPLLPALVLAIFYAGCSPDSAKEGLDAMFELQPTPEHPDMKRTIFRPVLVPLNTRLSVDQVLPAVRTEAQGKFEIRVSRDGQSMQYDLVADKIYGVTGVGLHLASAEANGKQIVRLFGKYSDDTVPVMKSRSDNLKLSGEITSADIDEPRLDMRSLTRAILNGNVYIAVYTEKNPDGEIRGQL